MQYFVVMIDYGRRGREAIVDPEITRREVVARVSSGEYRNISFIHEIADSSVEDVTADILSEACLPEVEPEEIDQVNIYWAGILAMRRAIAALPIVPQHVLIDGRKLYDFPIPQP